MRTRLVIVLLVIVALIAGTLAIRDRAGTPGDGDRASGDRTDGTDPEAPIVAPSRVVSVEGEARVVLD
ncbi:MAG: hypothetical protein ACREM9_13640, partial [Gemmatimonadales bacterium]